MSDRAKVTLGYLFDKVSAAEPITMLTCYDYPTAHFQEQVWR
jgi:ketopantoate hydroxymethyltransferase